MNKHAGSTNGRSWWLSLDRRQFAGKMRKRAIEDRARLQAQERWMATRGIERIPACLPTQAPDSGSEYWREGVA